MYVNLTGSSAADPFRVHPRRSVRQTPLFDTDGAGTTGACGKRVSDSSKVVALSKGLWRQHCGKTVTIKNTRTGKTVKATVNDEWSVMGNRTIELTSKAPNALTTTSTSRSERGTRLEARVTSA